MSRFQFSLRTLLIVVTVVCLLLGYEVYTVRQRAEVYEWLRKHEFSPVSSIKPPLIPPGDHYWSVHLDDKQLWWHRKLLGDHFVDHVSYPSDFWPDDLNRVKATFPEAIVEHPLEWTRN